MRALKVLATYTEPSRVRAVVAAVLALCLALGVVLPFDLPAIAEALILLFAAVLPLAQGEFTRAAVVSPATADKEVGIATGLATGGLTPTVHPQTPGVADHAADE